MNREIIESFNYVKRPPAPVGINKRGRTGNYVNWFILRFIVDNSSKIKMTHSQHYIAGAFIR